MTSTRADTISTDATAKSPPLVSGIEELRAKITEWRAAGERIALVPTMGALHDGHLSLVHLARANADRVVVSIFVNPTQFAPHEDFQSYPRDEARDLEMLAELQTDLVFTPTAKEMYPLGYSTTVTPGSTAIGLETTTRPHFFAGVATVVLKLLNACSPDIAIFGEKDYQQLQVIRQMTRDLNVPTDIIGAPTLREEDGLAMSSRNTYLSPAERAVAGRLNIIMAETSERIRLGYPIKKSLAQGRAALFEAGFDDVDYLEYRDAATLEVLLKPSSSARILAAVQLRKTRLIDNFPG